MDRPGRPVAGKPVMGDRGRLAARVQRTFGCDLQSAVELRFRPREFWVHARDRERPDTDLAGQEDPGGVARFDAQRLFFARESAGQEYPAARFQRAFGTFDVPCLRSGQHDRHVDGDASRCLCEPVFKRQRFAFFDEVPARQLEFADLQSGNIISRRVAGSALGFLGALGTREHREVEHAYRGGRRRGRVRSPVRRVRPFCLRSCPFTAPREVGGCLHRRRQRRQDGGDRDRHQHCRQAPSANDARIR